MSKEKKLPDWATCSPDVWPTYMADYADGEGEMRQIEGGLTLRDLFAGMAMMGMRAGGNVLSVDSLAKVAYDQADALLTERTVKADPRPSGVVTRDDLKKL